MSFPKLEQCVVNFWLHEVLGASVFVPHTQHHPRSCSYFILTVCSYSFVSFQGRDILRNSLHSGMPVNTLFEKFDIRISYRHFLLITFFARSTEELAVLGGLVNSRLRDLAQLLDDMDHVQETRIHRVPIG
ncbi:hypothetical protein D915_010023 [Fasciola hepatica]|uniref:Poly(A) polymerase RNA-binding domain-containing protein n=1 Tax=Fasciola hepatica TaxID=6192 RepID=A0A4E0QY81_FASHE|nr:hypothetical protein D915_010023 [Fasciola hepatica]